MDSILIQGGVPLIGKIHISGAKNGSLPLMVASLLTEEVLELKNVPELSDVKTMIELLSQHGTNVYLSKELDESLTLKISSKNINNYFAPYDIVRKMRASFWVLGPLLARFGQAKVSLPGGCSIGTRQVDMHISALEAMGAKITIENGYVNAKVNGRLNGCRFKFSKKSVGATINAIFAAVLAKGETTLTNCAQEPEIIDLCNCLNKMGADISFISKDKIKIIGKLYLKGTSHTILPDRIEAGTYMIAAAATQGDLKLYGIIPELLSNLIEKLRNAGSEITESNNYIQIKHQGPIKPVDISTKEYPGFPTDLQAQFMCLMTISDGISKISENIFENRFMHVPELCRMGADISVNNHIATVNGVHNLTGAEVMASDLRASVSLVIAGLCARGETKVKRIYHLDRGFQNLEKKLTNCGAKIQRIIGDSI